MHREVAFTLVGKMNLEGSCGQSLESLDSQVVRLERMKGCGGGVEGIRQ